MDRRRFAARLSLGALGFCFPESWSRAASQDSFDIIIRGGRVLDGNGGADQRSDVGIRDSTIGAVGDLTAARAGRTINARGKIIAPGFIDVHTHSERRLLTNPLAESKIRQGVTTELVGMDGSSFAPAEFAESLSRLEKQGIAVNLGACVGQGTVRGAVMGASDRAPSERELGEMKGLVNLALEAGALGISSGLEYTPGGFAETEEIRTLCEVASGTSALYVTHMRNEDDRVVEACEEAIEIAEGASIGLHISHLKCQGERNWNKLDTLFERFDEAEARGVAVSFDRYPYLAYSTSLSNLMPIWSREGGTDAFIRRLRDEDTWKRIREAMEDKIALLGSWNSVMISSVGSSRHAGYPGKRVSELVPSGKPEQDPFVFVRDLIIDEANQVGMVGFGMSENNTARVLAHPKCMPASDGSSLADYGPLSAGSPHPRSYGTFPRVLAKYVREMKTMDLSEAIRKMTSLPADRFGLERRGRIEPNQYADIVIFDAKSISDKAEFGNPHQYAEGIDAVLVNGRLVFHRGERTDALPGKVLRARHAG